VVVDVVSSIPIRKTVFVRH